MAHVAIETMTPSGVEQFTIDSKRLADLHAIETMTPSGVEQFIKGAESISGACDRDDDALGR